MRRISFFEYTEPEVAIAMVPGLSSLTCGCGCHRGHASQSHGGGPRARQLSLSSWYVLCENRAYLTAAVAIAAVARVAMAASAELDSHGAPATNGEVDGVDLIDNSISASNDVSARDLSRHFSADKRKEGARCIPG